MAVRIVRLGAPRAENEGLRIGTVRRPPRGVPKSEFASGDWYDAWFPNLAPSAETVRCVRHRAPASHDIPAMVAVDCARAGTGRAVPTISSAAA